jgi:hypothetical protein
LFSSISIEETRKNLLPLIRMIHPDLFVQEATEIQKTNLLSLQNLNELWDGLELISAKVIKESASQLININSPLKDVYDVSFFCRTNNVTEINDSNNTIEKMKFVISIPKSLQNNIKINSFSFFNAIELILSQHNQLF